LRNQFTRKFNLLYLSIALAGLISLYVGAYNGGKLVYQFSIGIRSEPKITVPGRQQPKTDGPSEKDLFYPPEDSLSEKKHSNLP
jgi:hypothetical protein